MGQVIVGQLVTVIADGEVRLRRRVVANDGGVCFVCTDLEFTAASKEGREPICIGFRSEYVEGMA